MCHDPSPCDVCAFFKVLCNCVNNYWYTLQLIRGKVGSLALLRIWREKWSNGVSLLVFLYVYLTVQLQSPWRCFPGWMSKSFTTRTLTHTYPKVSGQAAVTRIDVGGEEGGFSGRRLGSVRMFSLRVYLDSSSHFLSLSRFCTAAADFKLRVLSSDLQNKHEVKVLDHLHSINNSCQ